MLVIDLFGLNLEDLFDMCGRRFSLKTVCRAARQMITRVQTIHEKNLIYRDIKPNNFLISLPGTRTANVVHMIDFGMAKLAWPRIRTMRARTRSCAFPPCEMRSSAVPQDVPLYSPAGVTHVPSELARNNACDKLSPIPSMVPPRQATFHGIQSFPSSTAPVALGRSARLDNVPCPRAQSSVRSLEFDPEIAYQTDLGLIGATLHSATAVARPIMAVMLGRHRVALLHLVSARFIPDPGTPPCPSAMARLYPRGRDGPWGGRQRGRAIGIPPGLNHHRVCYGYVPQPKFAAPPIRRVAATPYARACA